MVTMRMGLVLLWAAGVAVASCSDESANSGGAGGTAGAAGAAAAAGMDGGAAAAGAAGTGGAAGGGGAAGTGGGGAAGTDAGAPDAAGDAPISDGAGFDGNSACNYLVQLGKAVTAVPSGGAPSPQGGIITDGFYELVGVNLYGGAKGTTFQRSLRFVGNELKTVERDGSTTVDLTTTGTYAVAGTTLTRAITCPATAGQVWGFTAPASGTTFIAYETQGATGVAELVYQWNSP